MREQVTIGRIAWLCLALVCLVMVLAGCSINPATRTAQTYAKKAAVTIADDQAHAAQWSVCCATTRGAMYRVYPNPDDRARLDAFCSPVMSVCTSADQ